MSTPTLTDIPAEAEARAAATGSLLRLGPARPPRAREGGGVCAKKKKKKKKRE